MLQSFQLPARKLLTDKAGTALTFNAKQAPTLVRKEVRRKSKRKAFTLNLGENFFWLHTADTPGKVQDATTIQYE